jgi:hypothetical protein
VTLQSTVDIDVNDAKFQRFKDLFDKYTEALAKTPDVWKKAAAAQATGSSLFEKQTRALSQQVDQQRDLADAMDKQDKTLTHSDRLWTSMARTTKEVSGNIVSATTSLLRWTGIIGLVGGALGLGGFLGLEHLAGGVAGQRRSRLGRGISDIGQQRAFGVDFSRFVDADSFMDQVAEMEQDVRLQTPGFVGLGRGLSGNTENDALAFLRRGFAVAHGAGNASNLGMAFQAAGLSDMFSAQERMRLFNTTPSEFETQLKNNKVDAKAFNIQEKVAKDYQEAATAIERFSASTLAISAKALDPLALKIPALTDEFTKLIGAFAQWPVIKEAIDDIAGTLDNIAHPGKIWDKLNAIPATNAWDTVKNSALGKTIAGWFSPDKAWAASHFDAYMARLDQHAGLPPGFIEEWRGLERSGNNAVSRAGAIGQFQFTPDTWKQYGAGGDPRDPVDAANAASRYAAALAKEFGGDLAKMLAAVNAGPGRVESAVAKYGANWIAGLPAETQAYVGRSTVYIMNQTGGSATVAASQTAP